MFSEEQRVLDRLFKGLDRLTFTIEGEHQEIHFVRAGVTIDTTFFEPREGEFDVQVELKNESNVSLKGYVITLDEVSPVEDRYTCSFIITDEHQAFIFGEVSTGQFGLTIDVPNP